MGDQLPVFDNVSMLCQTKCEGCMYFIHSADDTYGYDPQSRMCFLPMNGLMTAICPRGIVTSGENSIPLAADHMNDGYIELGIPDLRTVWIDAEIQAIPAGAIGTDGDAV